MKTIRYIQTNCYMDDEHDEIYYDEESIEDEISYDDLVEPMIGIIMEYYFGSVKDMIKNLVLFDHLLRRGIKGLLMDLSYDEFERFCRYFEDELTGELLVDEIVFD